MNEPQCEESATAAINKLVRLIALQYAARKCKQNKIPHVRKVDAGL